MAVTSTPQQQILFFGNKEKQIIFPYTSIFFICFMLKTITATKRAPPLVYDSCIFQSNEKVIVFSTFSQNTELPRLKTSCFQRCAISTYCRVTGNFLGHFISLCQGKGTFLKILIKNTVIFTKEQEKNTCLESLQKCILLK